MAATYVCEEIRNISLSYVSMICSLRAIFIVNHECSANNVCLTLWYVTFSQKNVIRIIDLTPPTLKKNLAGKVCPQTSLEREHALHAINYFMYHTYLY